MLGGLVSDTLVDPRAKIKMSTGRKSNRRHASGYTEFRLLAGGGAGTVSHGDQVLSGLVGVAGLLGGDGDTVLSGLDTDSLQIIRYLAPWNFKRKRWEKTGNVEINYLVVGITSILSCAKERALLAVSFPNDHVIPSNHHPRPVPCKSACSEGSEDPGRTGSHRRSCGSPGRSSGGLFHRMS